MLYTQDVVVNVGAPNEDGQILYEQMRTLTGVYKVGELFHVFTPNKLLSLNMFKNIILTGFTNTDIL
jgi:hypothetical protein